MAQTNTPDGTLADRLLQPDPDAHKRWLLAASTIDLAARLHTDRLLVVGAGKRDQRIPEHAKAVARYEAAILRNAAALADLLTPRLGTACPECKGALETGPNAGLLECGGCGAWLAVIAGELAEATMCATCANFAPIADMLTDDGDRFCEDCCEGAMARHDHRTVA